MSNEWYEKTGLTLRQKIVVWIVAFAGGYQLAEWISNGIGYLLNHLRWV